MVINVLKHLAVLFDRKILLEQKYGAARHAPGTSNEALPRKYKIVLLLNKFTVKMKLYLIHLSKYSSDDFDHLMEMLHGAANTVFV